MKYLLCAACIIFTMNQNVFSQTGNGFTAAFDSLHNKLSVYYAFTDWKKVNWNALYSEFQPRVVEAESKNDSSAFIMALKEYTFRIPDGHIGFSTGLRVKKNTNWVKLEGKLRDQQIGGSYGFTLIKLDDGRFVVRLVTTGSPAELAGIKFGAEILEINDKSITDAVNSTPVIWAEQIPATKETKQLLQCRLIGRAPIATVMKIKFKNRGDLNSTTKTISAVNDNYNTYDQTSMLPLMDPPYINSKILQPSGYGYIQITSCLPLTLIFDFISAFENMLSNNVKGIVLDLRINAGGLDAFTSAVAGFCYSDTTHYEYWCEYDPNTKTFQRSQDILFHINLQTMSVYYPTKYSRGSIYIEPPIKTFKGPIVVMNSPRQVSSGEGIAMALQKLPQCKVVSFYGSHGSFGVVTDMSLLSPQDSLEVSYPYAQSLDINNKIQLDSDSDMKGGVIPNIRPPLNDQTIDQMYQQGIDVELNYAVQELGKMVIAVGIDNEINQKPVTYSLEQNYPNPFNPTTVIKYSIKKGGVVSLIVYNILGQEIVTLVNKAQTPGPYEVELNAQNLTSGIYFYRLTVGSFSETKKLLLLK